MLFLTDKVDEYEAVAGRQDSNDEFRRVITMSGLFDSRFYSTQCPDVDLTKTDPVLHYLEHGALEGRNPSSLFDTAYYLEHNADVNESGMNPLIHYIMYGMTEGRSPFRCTSAELVKVRDWRRHFSKKLAGKGLEIGALHRPMVRHDGMDIDYIDRYAVAGLREHYPELNDLPLVEADILGDAATLEGIDENTYDFLISAHVIEHMRNPIQAFEQWCRVVRPHGKIYLVVPDKRVTFDKHRARTTLPHMVLDYRDPCAKRDYEHYLDFAYHVSHKKDAEEALSHADHMVAIDYSIHFHVFIPCDVIELLRWISTNIHRIEILEGPCTAPRSDEFHFLVEVK